MNREEYREGILEQARIFLESNDDDETIEVLDVELPKNKPMDYSSKTALIDSFKEKSDELIDKIEPDDEFGDDHVRRALKDYQSKAASLLSSKITNNVSGGHVAYPATTLLKAYKMFKYGDCNVPNKVEGGYKLIFKEIISMIEKMYPKDFAHKDKSFMKLRSDAAGNLKKSSYSQYINNLM